MGTAAILLAEHDNDLRQYLRSFFLAHECTVTEAHDPAGILRAIRQNRGFDLLVTNASLGAVGDGLEMIQLLHRSDRAVPAIVLATQSSEQLAIAALKAGAADYLKPPFSSDELLASLQRCLARRLSLRLATTEPESAVSDLSLMIGESAPMRQIKAYARKVAASESNALITGETGTGKELIASFIHYNGRRRDQPFLCLNCAAIPDSLFESEVFGYERGAFTGAQTLKEGMLKLADGGTLFFDEIGDLSLYAQAKILRAIETKEVRRLGGKRSIPVDVRILAATNRDLEQLMAEDKFRPDLFFRLNVASIQLPPLREGKEDLLLLVSHYLGEMNRQFGLQVKGFTDETLAFLLHYQWPGNVRELKNLIEAIFINQPSQWITIADLPAHFRRRCAESAHLPADERDKMLQALFETNWNKRLAAQKLHWSRMTLYRKMTKYHIVHGGKNAAPAREP